MDWTALLRSEIENTYKATNGLLDLVDDDQLDWKPSTGENWMTMGQLLQHISNACGAPIRGFVTGDWGSPEGDMPAEELPTASSVDEARRLLAVDKKLALEALARVDEERLSKEASTAPWDPTEMQLGHRVLQMIQHLGTHKAQLFYYLKLQGKPVHTGHLWGM